MKFEIVQTNNINVEVEVESGINIDQSTHIARMTSTLNRLKGIEFTKGILASAEEKSDNDEHLMLEDWQEMYLEQAIRRLLGRN